MCPLVFTVYIHLNAHSSHFIVNNILEGMIWFWVPASLVICNDVFAYIWGITLGRTPLIKLSPKKTVEGFVGAFFSTVIFGVLWGTFFMRYDYMICPVHDLGVSAWSETLQCDPNPIFLWRDYVLPLPARSLLSTLVSMHRDANVLQLTLFVVSSSALTSRSSRMRLISTTSFSCPALHHLLRPLVVSSLPDSSAHSTLRTSATVFRATAV